MINSWFDQMKNSLCITEIYEDYRTMNCCKLKLHSQREKLTHHWQFRDWVKYVGTKYV